MPGELRLRAEAAQLLGPGAGRSAGRAVNDSGIGWPCIAASFGFSSNVSNCDGPPAMQRKMTRLACGAKWSGCDDAARAGAAGRRGANSRGCMQAGERDRAEAERRAAEKRAAGDRFVGWSLKWSHGMLIALELNQLRVIVSFRFNSTRLTEVQAASSAASRFFGRGEMPTETRASAPAWLVA